MTRKRYIKLLMACGVGRNYAAWAPRCVQASRVSYREDLACSLESLRAGVLPVSAIVQRHADGRLSGVPQGPLGQHQQLDQIIALMAQLHAFLEERCRRIEILHRALYGEVAHE